MRLRAIAERILPAGPGCIDSHCRKKYEKLRDDHPRDNTRNPHHPGINIEGKLTTEVIDRPLRLRESSQSGWKTEQNNTHGKPAEEQLKTRAGRFEIVSRCLLAEEQKPVDRQEKRRQQETKSNQDGQPHHRLSCGSYVSSRGAINAARLPNDRIRKANRAGCQAFCSTWHKSQ
jgi:hypothetical protein